MSTRIERRESRRHIRRARWSGIVAGAGVSLVLGLGAAGALPGVTIKAIPPETPAADAASATPAPAIAPTGPQEHVSELSPGDVGAAASAAGAANASGRADTVPSATTAAAKSADVHSADASENAAIPLHADPTVTETARAVAQVGNPTAKSALETNSDRATTAGSAPSPSARSTRPSRSASSSRAFGAPPRGTNQLTVSGCAGTGDPLVAGTAESCTGIEGNLAVRLVVPANGEALRQGSVSFSLPAGTSLVSMDPAGSSGPSGAGAGSCAYDGTVTVNNGVVTITGITCDQDAGFVWYFNATVESSPKSYTLSGGYRTDDQPRSTTNTFRLPADSTVSVV